MRVRGCSSSVATALWSTSTKVPQTSSTKGKEAGQRGCSCGRHEPFWASPLTASSGAHGTNVQRIAQWQQRYRTDAGLRGAFVRNTT